jgi:hypothetical protein
VVIAAVRVAVVLGFVAGCSLYLGNHDDSGARPPPAVGGSADLGCAGDCDPRGECMPSDETSCIQFPNCHAVYEFKDAAFGGVPDDFVACWTIAPTLPEDPLGAGSDCQGLDAHACALRDDCVTDLAFTAGGGEFGNCRAKANGSSVAGACNAAACGGITCTASCYPCADGTSTCPSCGATCGTFGGTNACDGFACNAGENCALRCNDLGVDCTPECIGTGS